MISDESLWRGDCSVINLDIVDFIIDEFINDQSKPDFVGNDLRLSFHREGFGAAAMEAAAMAGLAIESNIVALSEFIKHNETKILFRKGNAKELARTMVVMIENPELKQWLQKEALENVLKYFESNVVDDVWYAKIAN